MKKLENITVGQRVYTMGEIGMKNNSFKDFVFVSATPIAQRETRPNQNRVLGIYCHKDAIENCPYFLANDTRLEVIEMGENDHGPFIKRARIIG